MMIVKTIFSGFGGQGVLMMGFTMAHGAMSAGYHVTFLPSYGAEVRGGTANCTVAIADEEIASPIASEPDYIVVLNTQSLFAFQNRVAPGGGIFLNSSIVAAEPSRHNVRVFKIPAGELADKVGNQRVVNTIMMGAFLQKTGLIPPEVYLGSLGQVMGDKKKSIVEINRKAFAAGFAFAEELE